MKNLINRLTGKSDDSNKEENKEQTPEQKPNKLLELMLTIVDEMVKSAKSSDDESVKKKGRLAEMIFPEVIKDMGNNERPIDKKAAKEWAKACSAMIAMLAATAVKPNRTDTAISEMMREAKEYAQAMSVDLASKESNLLGSNNTGASLINPTPKVDTKAAEREAARKEKERYIRDLEAQAEQEESQQAKDALLRLAEMMKKELELDGKAA